MTTSTIKGLAWLAGSIIVALGLTVLDGTQWGVFATMVGPLVAGAFGVSGPRPDGKSVPPLLMLMLAIAGCSLPPSAVWPEEMKCGSDVAETVDTVRRVLLADGLNSTQVSSVGAAELQALAGKVGADAVACTIDSVARRWLNPGASQESLAAAARGVRFLRENGVDQW